MNPAEHANEDNGGPVHALKQRYEAWRESIRRRPNVERAYRIGVAVIGGAIVIGGLGLIPLPGPGWLIVFLGLAILATEFVWAERIERFARKQVSAWTAWLGRQSIVVRVLVGMVTFAFVLSLLYLTLRFAGVPSWVPDEWVFAIPGLTP
jgi:uncharacterized protein (TIGR02611 family)